MRDHSGADATKPYLEYLDKEMTIQGILSAFCVTASAAGLDRVLGADKNKANELITALQKHAQPYVIAAVIALVWAGWLFYLQRSALALLHGKISLAATREMQKSQIRNDSYSIEEALEVSDSWTLWNRYKWGLTLLAVSATECGLALIFAELNLPARAEHWLYAIAPFVFGAVFAMWLWYALREEEGRRKLKCTKPLRDLQRASRARSQTD
jgi:hypothetical protein